MSMDCDFLHILPELRDMFDAAAAGADVVMEVAPVLADERFDQLSPQ